MDPIASVPIRPAVSAASKTPPPNGPVAGKTREQIDKTARDFEAVFLGQISQLMLSNVEVDETFGGGHGEEMFRGILAEKLGQEFAARGGVGLSAAVREQMIRMQEGTNP